MGTPPQVWRDFAFSALESLAILDSVNEPELSWLIAHAERLTALHLCSNGIRVSSEALVSALRQIPTLEELCLPCEPLDSAEWRCNPDDLFLRSFRPSNSADNLTLCPNLKRLRFLDIRSTPDNEIINFVRARTSADSAGAGVALLTHVELGIKGPGSSRNSPIHMGLAKQLREGLHLTVEYTTEQGPRRRYSPTDGISKVPTGRDAFKFHISTRVTYSIEA
ncbi:F-box domain-containing protein [Mycena chlorophos]|uniref:F-box domain-containing protein n=1 Tax=Mycena chlorophos TaxID=658473 RepID=A0A8H6S1Z1_MYCCL|nr:F-box domain-containing protein [Mycena chlorophos]